MLKGIARALGLAPEEVFRRAGVIEDAPDPETSPGLGEWIRIFSQADDDTRQKMLQSARDLSGQPAVRRRKA